MLENLIKGDCLAIFPTLPAQSVDMILCDLPYGKTAAKWDSILPMEILWHEYKRLLRPHGVILLTAVQPFTSLLVTSNLSWYRYSWVWDKGVGIGINALHQPIRIHEDILVFAGDTPAYYPVKTPLVKMKVNKGAITSSLFGNFGKDKGNRIYQDRFPTSIIHTAQDRQYHIHPTQKPVELFEYLIYTYTQPNALVLDHCAGSMTTAIACLRTNRRYLCIEKEEEYFIKGSERVWNEMQKPIATRLWDKKDSNL